MASLPRAPTDGACRLASTLEMCSVTDTSLMVLSRSEKQWARTWTCHCGHIYILVLEVSEFLVLSDKCLVRSQLGGPVPFVLIDSSVYDGSNNTTTTDA